MLTSRRSHGAQIRLARSGAGHDQSNGVLGQDLPGKPERIYNLLGTLLGREPSYVEKGEAPVEGELDPKPETPTSQRLTTSDLVTES